MSLIYELSQRYKTISIVGMAKNSGKTTALNYFIDQAMDEGMTLGITSTGRDGESTDLVTGTEKPRVYLEAGTLVSVPTQLYELADAGLEILRMTEYHTSIGPLLLCRVAESGYVQIAGPVSTSEHRKLCGEMFARGAELVLIDGAIDRKSIAAPETSDAIILATGAVLSRSMRKVVEETAHIVGLYRLPCVDNQGVRDLIAADGGGRIMTISSRGSVRILDLKTGLGAGKYLDEAIEKETEYVYVPGAFTISAVADISPARLKKAKFILKDPTKIFIDSNMWQQLRKKGFKAEVLENIEVAAVTVNPCAPLGYSFEHGALLSAMSEALPRTLVLDVQL